jgi:LPXTG-site transpeptidase (sortase) family protein
MCLFSLQKLNFEIRLSVLRKDYQSMNKKIFVLFIVLILIVAIGFLFSYDKKVIEQEKQNTSEQLGNTEDVEQEVTEDDGFEEDLIGSLKIEKINLNGTVKEGSTNEILRDYIGHIEETAKYDGNVGLAAHNRGNKYSYFARINELEPGDEIVYTTKYGERKYIVDTKKEILETDWSKLEGTTDNRLTLITCIKNKVNQRLCVQAVQENI